MEKLALNFNTQENFWNLNPNFLTIKTFKSLYNGDKSKNKTQSSKIMWAVALLLDPAEENPYRLIAYEEKKDIIALDYIEDKTFDWENFKDLVEAYTYHALSLVERHLIELKEKLEKRQKFIASTDYTLDYYEETMSGKYIKKAGTASQLDKMVLDTIKIMELVETLQDKVNQQKEGGALRGGAKESLSETGQI